jgi:phage terminase small subunit
MKDIKDKYKSYDPRVVEFVSSVYEDCKNNNDHLNNYFFCCLDLLANQLKIYFFALDSIDEDSKISTQDAYKRISKNPAIAVMNKSHQEIINILSKLSLSPFDRAKLKRVQNADDDLSAENLINDLTA